MSYCRVNGVDSDVYVIQTLDHEGTPSWWCCGCHAPGYSAKDRLTMVEHLLDHRKRGDLVPQDALDRLHQEIEEALPS